MFQVRPAHACREAARRHAPVCPPNIKTVLPRTRLLCVWCEANIVPERLRTNVLGPFAAAQPYVPRITEYDLIPEWTEKGRR